MKGKTQSSPLAGPSLALQLVGVPVVVGAVGVVGAAVVLGVVGAGEVLGVVGQFFDPEVHGPRRCLTFSLLLFSQQYFLLPPR